MAATSFVRGRKIVYKDEWLYADTLKPVSWIIDGELKDPREDGCLCQGCGKRYKVDLIIPNDVWAKICPNKNSIDPLYGSGLLCGVCIMQRVEDLDEFEVINAGDN